MSGRLRHGCRDAGRCHRFATWVFATFHSSLPIAVYIALCSVIGIVATAMLTDYTNKDISAEYVGV